MEANSKQNLKENRQHGSEAFPLAAYWMNITTLGAPILECHWHDEVEFFYVIQGEVLFQLNTDYFLVRKGEAVFVESGEIHAGHSYQNADCMFGAVVFDKELLSSAGFDQIQTSFIAPFLERTLTFPRHITGNTHWERQLLLQIRTLLSICDQQDYGYELAVKQQLLGMLHTILPQGRHVNRSTKQPDSTKAARLKAAISYMQQHYEQPLKIKQIAEQIPMSEGQFCRFFKSMTRQTPIEYLNSYRIKRAAQLLLEQNSKISAIALDVGFEHISYFVKVFRKQMKCTPSEYRKRMQDEASEG